MRAWPLCAASTVCVNSGQPIGTSAASAVWSFATRWSRRTPLPLRASAARLTRDADLTIFRGIGDEVDYIDELLAGFRSRIAAARQFALDHRVLLLHASNDISLGCSALCGNLLRWALVTHSRLEERPAPHLQLERFTGSPRRRVRAATAVQ